MKRVHLFEFTDMAWYPSVFRGIQTDYLQFIATLNKSYRNLIPLFQRALESSPEKQIVDLCSGGTGPWENLQEQLKQGGIEVNIKLTDKYPNLAALHKINQKSDPEIEYLTEVVDATDVPPNLKGMRTLFEGFHHFKPEQAKNILQDAVDKRAAIGIFEASLKPPFGLLVLLLSPIMTIVSYVVMTPFIKPRTISRFVWTYLLPIVPLATCWDGIISLLRVYSEQELKTLTQSISAKDYIWELGQASTGTPIFVNAYLVGYPKNEDELQTPNPSST